MLTSPVVSRSCVGSCSKLESVTGRSCPENSLPHTPPLPALPLLQPLFCSVPGVLERVSIRAKPSTAKHLSTLIVHEALPIHRVKPCLPTVVCKHKDTYSEGRSRVTSCPSGRTPAMASALWPATSLLFCVFLLVC